MVPDAEGWRGAAKHLDLAGSVCLDPDGRVRGTDVAQERTEDEVSHGTPGRAARWRAHNKTAPSYTTPRRRATVQRPYFSTTRSLRVLKKREDPAPLLLVSNGLGLLSGVGLRRGDCARRLGRLAL